MENSFQYAAQKLWRFHNDDLHNMAHLLSSLPAQATDAACDQQKSNEKQQRANGEDRRDQNPQPQGQGTQPDKPELLMIAHCNSPPAQLLSVSVYTVQAAMVHRPKERWIATAQFIKTTSPERP